MTNENNDATERFIWKEGDIEITRAHPEEDGIETHVHHEGMGDDHDGRTHTHAPGEPVTHAKFDAAAVLARALRL